MDIHSPSLDKGLVMQLLLLHWIWEALETIHASVENWTRDHLGEVNLTVLHMIREEQKDAG